MAEPTTPQGTPTPKPPPKVAVPDPGSPLIAAPFDAGKDMETLASGGDVDFDVPDVETPTPHTTPENQGEPPPIPKESGETPGEPGSKPEAPPTPEEQPPGTKPKEEQELEQPFEAPAPRHPKARELREAYEQRGTELETLRTRNRELEQQIASAPKPADDLTPKIESLQAENAQLQQQLAAVAYERSPGYQKQYIEPYKAAMREAYGLAKEVKVKDPETGEERQGTTQDFDRLLNLPFSDAARLSSELYGTAGSFMLGKAREIRTLYNNAEAALTKANEGVEASMQEQRAQQQMQMANFRKADEAIVAQYPAYFKATAEEPEKEASITKQLQLYDAVSKNPKVLTPDQYVRTVALWRRQVASFPWMVSQVNRLKKQIAELQGQLDEYQESEPGGGEPGGPGSETPGSQSAGNYIPDAHKEIDDLAE